MYELTRVRLYSVGPPGARYEDVTIDLSQVGKPVAHAQLPLYGEASVFRPSPASVLFLENGGGKSVLIKLVFSVMLPGRRQIVGTSNTRVLDKFVERGDVAHVVLEWMHTETGRLLITGKVAEWRPRRNSAEDGLSEIWYSLRPGRSVDVSSLPFAEDGNNLVLGEFRSRLIDLYDQDPSLELFWEDRHRRWADRLTTLGLDPELFEFQRKMNAGEGEAAEAFTFNTDEALVEFLLKAVLPNADAVSLEDSLDEFAGTLANRNALELERDFVAAVLDHLTPLAVQHGLAETAKHDLVRREVERQGFVATVVARAEREQALEAVRQTELGLAETALNDARKHQDAVTDLRTELARRLAKFRVDEASEAFNAADKACGTAAALVQAWEATGPLIDYRTKDEVVAQLREVLGRKQDAEAEALRIRDTHAGALIRALLAAATMAVRAAGEEEKAAGRSAEEATKAQKESDAAAEAAASAKATAERLDGAVAEVTAEVEVAVRDGLVADIASVPATAELLVEQACLAEAAVGEQEARITELDSAVDTAQAALVEARGQESTAKSEHGKASAAVAAADAAMTTFAAEPRLAALVEGTEVVFELDHERLVSGLTEALDAADRDRTGIRVAQAADERARVALDSADNALHPPAPEVEDLVRLLDDEGIRCHSGWDVLADIPDEGDRRELVARLPHLAAGVLLNDPDELERARTLVARRGYEPTSLVAVASTQSFDLDTESDFDLIPQGEAGFVVPPNPALYDHDAARAECARITERHVERLQQLADLDERYAADQRLKARLLQWREEYPPGKYGELCGLRSTTSENLATAEETTRQHVAEVAEFIKLRTGAREVRAGLGTAARLARTRADRLSRLRERVAQSEAWQQEAVEARAAEEAEKARTTAARARREAAVVHVREHERLADRHRATAERLRGEVIEVGGDAGATAEPDPLAQPVPVLRRLLAEAETLYVKAQVGSDLLTEVANAKNAAKEARRVLRPFPEPIRVQAAQLIETPEGADMAGRAAALAAAKSKQDRAGAERDAALGTLNQQIALYDVLPAPSGPVVLPEEPADTSAARRLLTAAEAALREAVSSVSGKEAACTKASGSLRLVRQVVAGFARITDNQALEDEQDAVGGAVVVAPYEGDPARAWERHLDLAKAVKECGKACVAADKLVNQLAEALRTTASDARFHKLVSAARTQITSVPPSELPAARRELEDVVAAEAPRSFRGPRAQRQASRHHHRAPARHGGKRAPHPASGAAIVAPARRSRRLVGAGVPAFHLHPGRR